MVSPQCNIFALSDIKMSSHEGLGKIDPQKSLTGGDESIIVLHAKSACH